MNNELDWSLVQYRGPFYKTEYGINDSNNRRVLPLNNESEQQFFLDLLNLAWVKFSPKIKLSSYPTYHTTDPVYTDSERRFYIAWSSQVLEVNCCRCGNKHHAGYELLTDDPSSNPSYCEDCVEII